jgi:RNA polymerase sigma-70 factor (ECF subfamily)
LLEGLDADGSIRIAVRKVLADPETVMDVCQDVLIVVAEQIGSWEGRSSFTTWVQKVAYNKAVDHLRKRTTDPLPETIMSDSRRISSLIATRVVVNDAIAQLPERYRDPVLLRDVEQYDYDEIARILDLLPATVRTRVGQRTSSGGSPLETEQPMTTRPSGL